MDAARHGKVIAAPSARRYVRPLIHPTGSTRRAGGQEGEFTMPDQDTQPELRRFIDRNLVRVYQDTMQAEVPDRFKLLLAALKAKGEGNSE
jgi:hypothetical protein